jgi:anthranilate phosphoribosyltransferase
LAERVEAITGNVFIFLVAKFIVSLMKDVFPFRVMINIRLFFIPLQLLFMTHLFPEVHIGFVDTNSKKKLAIRIASFLKF